MEICTCVRGFFKLFVSMMTFVLAGLCFYKFIWDYDISQIFFQKYHQDSHSIYPTLTLCILNEHIFQKEKFSDLKKHINAISYASFLKGEHWDDDMSAVDFDDVTLNIEDYIEGVGLSSTKNQTVYRHCSENFQRILHGLLGYNCAEDNNDTKLFYSSFKNHEAKCISINIPFDKDNIVLKLRLLIKTAIIKKLY